MANEGQQNRVNLLTGCHQVIKTYILTHLPLGSNNGLLPIWHQAWDNHKMILETNHIRLLGMNCILMG